MTNSPRPNTSSPLANSSIIGNSAASFNVSADPGEGEGQREGDTSYMGSDQEENTARSTTSSSDQLSELGVETMLRPGSRNSDTTVKGKGRVSFESPMSSPKEIPGDQAIFSGISHMDDVHLYRESQSMLLSLLNYHAPYIPNKRPDPLFEYGIKDGLLPGRTLAETDQIRNIILRLTSPHVNCLWDNLGTAVKEFCAHDFWLTDLVKIELSPSLTIYSLYKEKLIEIAHLILALHQILDSFSDFFYKGKGFSFSVDPDYKLTRTLAVHTEPSVIMLTGAMLQKRCKIAANQILTYSNTLKKSTLNFDECESVMSYNSTLPDVRESYSTLSPLQQITAFASRMDYSTDLNYDAEQGRSLLLQRQRDLSRPEAPLAPYSHHERVHAIQPPEEVYQARLSYFSQNVNTSEPDSISQALQLLRLQLRRSLFDSV